MRVSIKLILSAIFLTLLFEGCASKTATPEVVRIDASLPTVSLNGHMTDLDSIAFEWKSIESPAVEGVHIYRSNPADNDGRLHRIFSTPNRYVTHFVDTGVQPGTLYKYSFSTYTANGTESNPSPSVEVHSMAALPSVSFFHSVDNLPRSAKLIWRPHTNLKVNGYRIEKLNAAKETWDELATIKGRLSAEYIDTELEDNKVYKYRIRATTYDNILSQPSDIVKVVTKPLPATVQNIRATEGKPRMITLAWDPNPQSDLDYYNIYRSDDPGGGYSYHVRTRNTLFDDHIDKDGAVYFYRVTAIDADGLESKVDPALHRGSTMERPATPTDTKAAVVNGTIEISWSAADDKATSYKLIKTARKGWLESTVQEIKGLNTTRYRDNNVAADTLYHYQVVAIDANGIESTPTDAVEISFESK